MSESEKPTQVIERDRDKVLKASSGADTYMKDKYAETQETKRNDEVDLIAQGIWHWPKPLEVWPFTAGIPFLGLVAGGVAFYINKTFRNNLLLGHHMRIASYLGLTGVCSTMSAGIHYFAVTEKIFQNDPKQCSICLQVRATMIQLAMGMAYPLFVSPMMNYTVASAFKARHLPKIYKRPTDVLSYVSSVYKPIKGNLAAIAAGQVILAMGVTYMEQYSFLSKVLPVLKGERGFAQRPQNSSPELNLTDELYPAKKSLQHR